MVAKGAAKTTTQKLSPVSSLHTTLKMKARKQPMKIPIVINSWWKTPKMPESSQGVIYLTIKGTNAL